MTCNYHPPRAQWLQAGGSLNTKEIAYFLQPDTLFIAKQKLFKVLWEQAGPNAHVLREWYAEHGFPDLPWRLQKLGLDPITSGMIRYCLDAEVARLRLAALALDGRETVESLSYLGRFEAIETLMQNWRSGAPIYMTDGWWSEETEVLKRFCFHARQWERKRSEWRWRRLLSKRERLCGQLECLQAAVCLDIALGKSPFSNCRILETP